MRAFYLAEAQTYLRNEPQSLIESQSRGKISWLQARLEKGYSCICLVIKSNSIIKQILMCVLHEDENEKEKKEN